MSTNRGRFSFSSNRGRSPSRRPFSFRGRGATGFFDIRTQQEEQAKLDNIRKDVDDLKTFTKNKAAEIEQNQNTKEQQKARTKISSTVEAGKEFISKFFRGFNQNERGNIKVQVSPSIVDRLVAPYTERIKTYSEVTFQQNDDKPLELRNKFQGITEIGTAIKLFKSSTEFERNLNYKFSSIRNLEVPLPKRMNVLINQLGKTDLTNDNRIRLKNQHLLVRRFLLRGVCNYLQSDADQYLKKYYKYDNVLSWLKDPDKFNRLLDESTNSLSLLKDIGRKFFLENIERNYNFKLNEKTYVLRLPGFNFKHEVRIDDILEYFKNSIFTDFGFDQDTIYKIIASLVFQVAKYSWLRDRDKTMEELDSQFENTIAAKYTFKEIMEYCDIEFINEFIDENVLDDVVNEVIFRWKSADSTHFYQMFNMEEIKFSEYGSDAQLVEIDKFYRTEDDLGKEYDKIVNRTSAQTVLKTTDHGAIVGLMLGYSSKVEFSTKFNINFDSKNDQILREFIKNDFKM